MEPVILPIDLIGVNCYLIKTSDGYLLFDTGGHLALDKQFTNRRDLLLQKLQNAGCTKENLKLILLSHGDSDHSGNAAYLRDHYHAPIAMHASDVHLVETPSLPEWMQSFHYQSPLINLGVRLLNPLLRKATQKVLEDYQSFTPDILLEDGFHLLLYGLDAVVLHTPGHTNGSIAVRMSDGSLLIGDTYTNTSQPVPVSNANDFAALAQSIRNLKKKNMGTIYPGHGAPFHL